jgi:hypothetical protein
LSVDLRALGRLGDPVTGSPRRKRRRGSVIAQRDGISHVVRRRRTALRLGLWGTLTAVSAISALAMLAGQQTGDELAFGDLPALPAEEPAARPGIDAVVDRASRTAPAGVPATTTAQVFAAVDGLRLVLPHPVPALVAFHEASRAEALALDPVGHLLRNDNLTKFNAPDDTAGPGYAVLSSRGRARPATSAADVAVPEGSLLAAPVSGTVVEVREYVLYGKTRDWRIVIEPDSHPTLHVVLIHLRQPRVAPGDAVVAGDTVLGAVRSLSFGSHIDYVLPDLTEADGDIHFPHTHIEVKPATASAPLDPNLPAEPPDL